MTLPTSTPNPDPAPLIAPAPTHPGPRRIPPEAGGAEAESLPGLRYGSVCSGIEAASVAWRPLGWEPAWVSEIDPAPSAVLAHRLPGVPNRGDFTRIREDAGIDGSIDLLVGGTPCQGFSLAGLMEGLDDDRSNLALEFLRLADAARPAWVVWENVPGCLATNGGRDFGAILGGLAGLGYGWAYRVLDAQHFGCACSRRRVFVVGYLGDWRPAAAVLLERDCLAGDRPGPGTEPSRAAPRTRGGPAAGPRAIAVNDRKRDGGRRTEWRVELAFSPIVRRGGGNKTARQIVDLNGDLRTLTPRETERLLGFPDDYTLVPFGRGTLPDTHRNACLGNSMAVPVMAWIGSRIQMVRAILLAEGRGA